MRNWLKTSPDTWPGRDVDGQHGEQFYVFHGDFIKFTLAFNEELIKWNSLNFASFPDISFKVYLINFRGQLLLIFIYFKYWTNSELGRFRSKLDENKDIARDFLFDSVRRWTIGRMISLSKEEWNNFQFINGEASYLIAFKNIEGIVLNNIEEWI